MYFCSYEFRYTDGSVIEEILENLLNIDFNCFSPRDVLKVYRSK